MKKVENRLLRDKRGISPVVATVILVAVTIVVAVAVAYWMGGIAGLYTRFERLEISSTYATYDSTNTQWNVTMNVRNTGSADATVTDLLINGKPWDDAFFDDNISDPSLPKSVASGQETSVTFSIDYNEALGFRPGVSIEIKLHTASGQDYPKTITLD